MLLANAAAVLATLLSLSALVPQLRKTLKTKDIKGVSISWAGLGFVSNGAWIAYVVWAQLWASFLATFSSVLFYGWLFFILARLGARFTNALSVSVVWGIFLYAVASVFGFLALGTLLAVAYGLQVGPSLWTAFRTSSPSGISPTTWLLSGIEALLWGGYGFYNKDIPFSIYGVTGVIASSLILMRWFFLFKTKQKNKLS